MDDENIIDLFLSRSEAAIAETAAKYGRYCRAIAYNILHNDEDSEECVNDTYLRVWDAIPPQHPDCLRAFLGKITRNLSLNRYEMLSAEKRGAGQLTLVLEELHDCIPADGSVEQIAEGMESAELINRFLAALPADTRKIFVRRYWYSSSVSEIAEYYGFSESKVKMTLLRTRNKLKKMLEKR